MEAENSLSRRQFLRFSAITAASVMVAACGGETSQQGGANAPVAATTPAEPDAAEQPAAESETQISIETAEALQAPGDFKEAPMLAQMVKDGKLPAVNERLPKNPYVVPHAWVKEGKYGGTWQVSASDPWGISGLVQEYQYGHSPLRWLKDGLEVGPGLAESWESNDDTSQWTFHFREGLKWSDGKPWTVDDIIFWWEDMVLNEEHPEGPPDEGRSGKNTLMTLKKIDDLTIQMIFDAPTPLTADRLAMWVNRGIGPQWMVPKHYGQQFHPKYNQALKDKKDWVDDFNSKIDFARNPECPTMTGWRLTALEEGVRGQWERNPYYWCVNKDGSQLPYMDRINVTGFQDAEVQKLAILNGKVDYSQFHGFTLADVSALKQGQERSKLEVRFWDIGGIENIFFFNYDYRDAKMRQLIRVPEFRKGLSHAVDRKEVQKSIWFNTGELTTGTMSPKAIEYRVNEEGKQMYAAWRDSAITYDLELANQLLDKAGLKKGADGKRTMPDGSPLTIRLDHQADAGKDSITKNQYLRRFWQAVGIEAKLNPVPPASWQGAWYTGELMSNTTWGVGDGPNHLVYPQWLVPIEHERWAPLEGEFYNQRGTPNENKEKDVDPYERTPPRMEPEPGGPVEQLWKLYDQSKVEIDPMKRHQLVWEMIKVHIEHGPFYMGFVANPPGIILVSTDLRNVPQKEDLALGGFTGPWIHPTPAVYDPESWYFEDPSAHT